MALREGRRRPGSIREVMRVTLDETYKVVFTLRSAYPAYYARYTKTDFESMAESWGMFLEDYSLSEALMGLKAYVSTETRGFPPSPGQIIDKIHMIKNPPAQEMTAEEAWGRYVYPAICDGYYHAKERFEAMPERIRKAVGSPDSLRELSQGDIDTVQSVEKSHFIRTYNEVRSREHEEARLPKSIRALISQTTGEMPELTAMGKEKKAV